VTIELAQRGPYLLFKVADDGHGYDARPALPTGGLQNMTDRIGALGGQLTIHTSPGSGTTILGNISLRT